MQKTYPYVLVPGMAGWGDTSALSKILPYWGFSHFDMAKVLNARGHETHAASVAPLGSAWDRACELYAQLVGCRVDYGKAHSEKFGHARYGVTYEKPLFEGWSAQKKVNLICHSFGGVTARMMSYLLAEGDKAEQEATQDGTLSPLFAGGNRGMIFSITTLTSPHNGTDLQFAMPKPISKTVQDTYYLINWVVPNTPLKKLYDVQLGHFGIGCGESFLNAKEMRHFCESEDNVFYDVGVDGSMRINRSICAQDDVYYFSFPVCGTQANKKGNQKPKEIFPMLHVFSDALGSYTTTTEDGYVVDNAWKSNDGVVNTISAEAPATEPSEKYDPAHVEKGVWNIMPTIIGDHGTVVGWTAKKRDAMPIICKQVARIDALSKKECD